MHNIVTVRIQEPAHDWRSTRCRQKIHHIYFRYLPEFHKNYFAAPTRFLGSGFSMVWGPGILSPVPYVSVKGLERPRLLQNNLTISSWSTTQDCQLDAGHPWSPLKLEYLPAKMISKQLISEIDGPHPFGTFRQFLLSVLLELASCNLDFDQISKLFIIMQ